MSVADWTREQHERAISSSNWWTAEHQKLARQLMRELRARRLEIRLMAPQWDEDTIQELLVVYPKRIRSWNGKNYKAWLRTALYRTAVDMLRKWYHTRAKPEHRPEFVNVDDLPDIAADIPEHSRDWHYLVLHSVLRDVDLSGADLRLAAEHHRECDECALIVHYLAHPELENVR